MKKKIKFSFLFALLCVLFLLKKSKNSLKYFIFSFHLFFLVLETYSKFIQYKIKDDFLDCFGDPEVIGKIGTDIEDNKCSWLIVQALSKANGEQRKRLDVIFYFYLFYYQRRIYP